MGQSERLKTLIKELNHNVSTFSAEIKVSRTTISDVINEVRDRKLKGPTLEAIKKTYPKVNIKYLTGESDDIWEKSEAFNQCPYCSIKDEIITNLRLIIDEQRKIIDQKTK